MLYSMNYNSPVGKLFLVSDEENLIGLLIEGQKYFCDNVKDEIIECPNLKILNETKAWLDRYFNNKKPSPNELKLKPTGSEFRQAVWKILCEIPYGKVITYGEIAKKIANMQGKEKISAQAVGGAVGHNPVSIIIPCHRVVGANGNLTGYAGGILTKYKLLEFEKVDMKKLYISK